MYIKAKLGQYCEMNEICSPDTGFEIRSLAV